MGLPADVVELYHEYSTRQRRWLRYRVDVDDIDDVLHEVYITLLRNSDTSNLPKLWFVRARQRLADYYRKRRHWLELSPELPEPDHNLTAALQLHHSIAQLSSGQRIATLLQLDGFSLAETAYVLDVSVPAVKMLRQRARRKLKYTLW